MKNMQEKIIAKLLAENIEIQDYNNCIKILSKCVMWSKLIKEYKKLVIY